MVMKPKSPYLAAALLAGALAVPAYAQQPHHSPRSPVLVRYEKRPPSFIIVRTGNGYAVIDQRNNRATAKNYPLFQERQRHEIIPHEDRTTIIHQDRSRGTSTARTYSFETVKKNLEYRISSFFRGLNQINIP